MAAPDNLRGLVEEITPQAIELRRELHRWPEPAHQEHETTSIIASVLARNGIPFNDRIPKTGGWVDIGDSPNVGFRADLDALPIVEPQESVPRSVRDGWMHACGHDAHTAIAFGIALTLHRLDPDIGIRLIFQPGEEANPGGAVELVAEGLADPLKSLLAFHVDPTLAVGHIGTRVGPITGSTDSLTITLHGPGGHTSRPHKTVDLVDAAAKVVAELPSSIRRAVDARSPIVTVFGTIHGGNAPNVIPTEITLGGTVRTLDPHLWDVLPGLVDKTVGAIVGMTGAGYRLDYQQGVPPVVNDRHVIGVVESAIAKELGDDVITPTKQSMGGEDFANYLAVTPGALLRLGASSGGGDLHSASFKVNDAAVGFGIRAGVSALLELKKQI